MALGQQTTPGAAHKRKSSTNEGGAERAFKHRASQACQSCRTRKVRCDVLKNGSRCTNCRLDNVECIVIASRRGKNNHTNRMSTEPLTVQAMGDPKPATMTLASWIGAETGSPPVLPTPNGQVPVSITFDQDSDITSGDHPSRVAAGIRNGLEPVPHTAYEGLLTPDTFQSPSAKHSLPAFIAPLSNRILSEDLEFLVQKGALNLPDPELRMEILRSYLFSVHPFLPMLDWRPFLHAMLHNRQDGGISLLLFQAIMFAGAHSLSLEVVQRLGFESAKQVREVFYDRVRLLYEFDVESDSAAVLQSLILMSSWYSKWNERRHTWHWTGLAYDVARSMGLHRDPTERYASDGIRRFRKRLWWSLYIRDRMIALGTRRPRRIRDDEFDVTLLTLEDFDLEPLEELHQGHSIIPSVEENTSAALMCIQLARLCISIGRITSSQYTTLCSQPDIPHTMMVVSRRDEGRLRELESCDRELNEWYRALDTNIRRMEFPPTSLSGEPSCSEVHCAILNMIYLTAMNVLHRAQALQPLPDSTEAQIAQKSSRAKVKDAARLLTKVSQDMLIREQVRFVGIIGVTGLITASLSHMLDITSGDEDVRDASTFRLYQSLQVLQTLREIYASADAAVSFLTSVARRAGITVPAQVAESAADFISAFVHGLVKSTTNRRPNSAWKHSASFSSDVESHNEIVGSSKSPWLINPQQAVQQTPSSRYRQDPRHMVTIIRDTTSRLSPSAVAMATSSPVPTSSQLPTSATTDHNMPLFEDANLIKSHNQGASGAVFDWSNGVAELEPTAFNYDFYSDAFWLMDDHLQSN